MAGTLSHRQVQIWCAKPNELDPDHLALARKLMSDDEIQRLERFLRYRDRAIYTATRVLVRTVLSRYEAVSPAHWKFETGPHGRPEVAHGLPPLQFNLSHTNGLVVCAVARALQLGIDAEHIGRQAPLEVADHFFAESEAAAIRSLPHMEQPRRFFQLWTLKESYVKAINVGLALPLDKIVFTISRNGQTTSNINNTAGCDPARWQFVQYWPTPEHVVSLCVRRDANSDTKVTLGWHSLQAALEGVFSFGKTISSTAL